MRDQSIIFREDGAAKIAIEEGPPKKEVSPFHKGICTIVVYGIFFFFFFMTNGVIILYYKNIQYMYDNSLLVVT